MRKKEEVVTYEQMLSIGFAVRRTKEMPQYLYRNIFFLILKMLGHYQMLLLRTQRT